MAVEIKSTSTAQTELIGENVGKSLRGNEVIAMYGGLGMGKTAFVRGLARGLGISQVVSSPTFALVNEYNGKFNLYHFDMYRVNSWDELDSTGFFDYIDNGVIAVEWSENIEAALPDDSIRIWFSKGNSEDERIIRVEGMSLEQLIGDEYQIAKGC